ncbi:17421_t:CDS:2, partial [Funneliformis caledonium]
TYVKKDDITNCIENNLLEGLFRDKRQSLRERDMMRLLHNFEFLEVGCYAENSTSQYTKEYEYTS